MGKIKGLFRFIKDIFSISLLKYFTSSQYGLLLNYQFGRNYFLRRPLFFRYFRKFLIRRQQTKYGCQLSYKATIHPNVKFPHPLGVVIGDYVTIGSNVKIWQQVTLGSHGKPGERPQYPVIENDVKIFAGAKIIGGVTIGQGAIIAANAVVLIDIPPYSIAAGIPAKIISPKIQNNTDFSDKQAK